MGADETIEYLGIQLRESLSMILLKPIIISLILWKTRSLFLFSCIHLLQQGEKREGSSNSLKKNKENTHIFSLIVI